MCLVFGIEQIWLESQLCPPPTHISVPQGWGKMTPLLPGRMK